MTQLSSLRDLINEALRLLRQSDSLYKSSYWLDKHAIRCAFQCPGRGCSQFDKVLIRFSLIDNLYSTKMNMRPYGLGELAEVISLFGTDATVKILFEDLLKTKSTSHFEYEKSEMVLYRDGNNSGKSNLFSEGFGLEKGTESKKRALSLISKYAYFLMGGKFPIYDSIVRKMYPRFWKALSTEKVPRFDKEIEKYIVAIDAMRNIIGNNITYDELDNILWHIGKIVEGNLSLVLSMEDYIALKGNKKPSSPISKDPLLNVYWQISQLL